jgi:hypothetical protein
MYIILSAEAAMVESAQQGGDMVRVGRPVQQGLAPAKS